MATRYVLAVVVSLAVSFAGTSAQTTSPPANTCQCEGFLTSHIKVCGTDGKTYNNACDLTDQMAKNSSLGMHCRSPCPCPAPHDLSDSCTVTNRLDSPTHRKQLAKKIRVKLAGTRRSALPKLTTRYCLTDGTEWDRNRVWCALETKKAEGVGLRCHGFCSKCKSILNSCPSRLLETIPLYDETKPALPMPSSVPEDKDEEEPQNEPASIRSVHRQAAPVQAPMEI